MSGKGSGRRPQNVGEDVFAANWERALGKGPKTFTVTVPADLPTTDASKPNGAAGASKAIRLVGSTPAGAAIYVDDATGE